MEWGGVYLSISFNGGGGCKKLFRLCTGGGLQVNFMPCYTHFRSPLLIIIAEYLKGVSVVIV